MPRERPLTLFECPDCGDRTVVSLPRSSWMVGCLLVLAILLLVHGVIETARGRRYALQLILFPSAVLIPVFLLNLRFRGITFARRGFSICPHCGWARCGEEEGRGISRFWFRALAMHRWLLILLVPLTVWFFVMAFLSKPDIFLAPVIVSLMYAVAISSRCFLPAGRPIWWRPGGHSPR